MYGLDGTQMHFEFPVDLILTRPEGTSSAIRCCWFNIRARVGNHALQEIERLFRQLHRRIDEDDRCWV